jgi:hypothetical protein
MVTVPLTAAQAIQRLQSASTKEQLLDIVSQRGVGRSCKADKSQQLRTALLISPYEN